MKLPDGSRRPVERTEDGRLFSNFCHGSLRRWEEFQASLEEVRGVCCHSVAPRLEAAFALPLRELELPTGRLRAVHEIPVIASPATGSCHRRLGLGLGRGLRGSISSRVAAWYTKEAMIAAPCIRSPAWT